MKRKIVLGLYFLVAALWLLTGLRDVFAPGFFTISSRVMGPSDIALEFATAAIFFALAGLHVNGHLNFSGANKK